MQMFAGILAHNLTRELQMGINPRERRTTGKRATLASSYEFIQLTA